MKSNTLITLATFGASLLLAGCETYSYTNYPVTYQVPISAPQFTSEYGPQDLPVNAVQKVDSSNGTRLYYQVVAPVPMTVYVIDNFGPNPNGATLAQFQGIQYSGWVVPTGNRIEFVFSAVDPIGTGTIQLTVSDHPIKAPATGRIRAPASGSQPGFAGP